MTLSGKSFGDWLVIGKAEKIKKHQLWLCRCSCGAEKAVYQTHLTRGSSKSCNRHGLSDMRAWASWMAMKARCLSKKHPKYNRYGGRGIKICERWMCFENFLKDMGERQELETLERIDSNKDYEPGNCKWATYIEQNNNKSDNVKILYRGNLYTRKDLAAHLMVTIGTLDYRLRVTGASKSRKDGIVQYVERDSFRHGPCKKFAPQAAP